MIARYVCAMPQGPEEGIKFSGVGVRQLWSTPWVLVAEMKQGPQSE